MSLPNDIARCEGVPVSDGSMFWFCQSCRRREPGDPDRQVMIEPAVVAVVKWMVLECPNRITT
jgi:hypothetical protein